MEQLGINMLISSVVNNTTTITQKAINTTNTKPNSKDNNSFDNQLKQVKDKGEDKDITNSNSVVKADKKNFSISKSTQVEKLDVEAEKNTPSEMILMLVHNVLNLPIELLEQTLKEVGLTAIDLLEPEKFNTFLTALYSEDDINNLLFHEDNLKNISSLLTYFEDIKQSIDLKQPILTQITDQKMDLVLEEVEMLPTQSFLETGVGQEILEENVQGILQENIQGMFKENVQESLMDTSDHLDIFDQEQVVHVNFSQTGLGIHIPIQAFDKTINTQLNYTDLTPSQPLTEQIIDKLDISSLGNTKAITMQLSPKQLGALSIQLVENNGVLVANIRVENEKTKQLLLSEINQLKETLEEQGLSIQELKVDIRNNSSHSQMEQQKQKSTRRIQQLIDKHLSEELIESVQQDNTLGQLVETEVDYMV